MGQAWVRAGHQSVGLQSNSAFPANSLSLQCGLLLAEGVGALAEVKQAEPLPQPAYVGAPG